MSVEGLAEVSCFEPGAVVRVRIESVPSIVLPSEQADAPSDGGLDLRSMFCVPIALVRTDVEDGVERWVQISDLTPWEPD